MNPTTLTLTDSAARRIAKEAARKGDPALMLRVAVNGGGCSGFAYDFSYDSKADPENDILVEQGGAKLVIDKISLNFIAGGEVDFRESMMESFFRIRNPQATSSCGCGASFSVKES